MLRGKKNFVMFGEIFDGNDDKVSSYTHNGELDAVVPRYDVHAARSSVV